MIYNINLSEEVEKLLLQYTGNKAGSVELSIIEILKETAEAQNRTNLALAAKSIAVSGQIAI